MRRENNYKTNRQLDFDARKSVYSFKNFQQKDYSIELKKFGTERLISKDIAEATIENTTFSSRGTYFFSGALKMSNLLEEIADWKRHFTSLDFALQISQITSALHILLGNPQNRCTINNALGKSRLLIRTNVTNNDINFAIKHQIQIEPIIDLDSDKPQMFANDRNNLVLRVDVGEKVSDKELDNAREFINNMDKKSLDQLFMEKLFIHDSLDSPPLTDKDVIDKSKPESGTEEKRILP